MTSDLREFFLAELVAGLPAWQRAQLTVKEAERSLERVVTPEEIDATALGAADDAEALAALAESRRSGFPFPAPERLARRSIPRFLRALWCVTATRCTSTHDYAAQAAWSVSARELSSIANWLMELSSAVTRLAAEKANEVGVELLRGNHCPALVAAGTRVEWDVLAGIGIPGAGTVTGLALRDGQLELVELQVDPNERLRELTRGIITRGLTRGLDGNGGFFVATGSDIERGVRNGTLRILDERRDPETWRAAQHAQHARHRDWGAFVGEMHVRGIRSGVQP